MTAKFSTLDWSLLVVYFLSLLGVGWLFWRRSQSSSEQFTTGGRDLSGWLCGFSIFATFLSSITFLALPGAAFDNDWNPFVFSLTLPLTAWIAVRWFLPYYRQGQEVSAYALLERRFGLWARWMASAFFLAFQLARMAFVMYLMALPLSIIFAWDIHVLILVTGVVVIVYATVGGILAVMWADAIQAVVLTLGAIISLLVIWSNLAEGPVTVWQIAAAQTPHKFSLGRFAWPPWSGSAFWLILGFGIFENLKNFGVDQNYIQRYVSARPQEAIRSIWIGALLYLPVSGLFLLIGTSLFAFYQQHPSALAEVRQIVNQHRPSARPVAPHEAKEGETIALSGPHPGDERPIPIGDRVFPHFIANYLPPGILGLLVAAIFSAAMSTVSTSLNSSATIVLSDFYLRGWSPEASDRVKLWVLRATTVILGCLATLGAWWLVSVTASALDAWWTISSILGAGILGLFLLGRLVPTAHGLDAGLALTCGLGVVAGVVCGPEILDKKLAIVFGSSTVVGTGWISARLTRHLAPLDSCQDTN